MSKPSPIERLKDGRSQVTVGFEKEKVKPAEEQALKRLGQNISLKGFRPGNAPAELLREKIGEDRLFEETVRILLNTELQTIVTANNLAPIIPPKVEAVSRDPLTVKVTFVERPKVSVKGAKTLAVKKEEVKLDTAHVDQVVSSVLSQFQEIKPVDRAAKSGDEVMIDFRGQDEAGKEIEGTVATAYRVILGKGILLPDFETALTGMKKGENKTFVVTMPKDYHAAHLKGKAVTFHAAMQGVSEVHVPELTDAFAKEKLQEQSASAFKKKIEEAVRDRAEGDARAKREQDLLALIEKSTTVTLADELVEAEERVLLEDLLQQLKEKERTFDQYLKDAGKTLEQLKKDLRENATKRLKVRFGIAELLTERNVTVSDEDLNKAVDTQIAMLPEEHRANAKKAFSKGGSEHDEILWRARVAKLFEEMMK